MRKLLFGTALIVAAVQAWAQQPTVLDEGTCGASLTWELTNDGTLTISGTGDMTDFTERGPWYEEYSNDILALKVADGVTSVGDFAFSGCTKLASVTLPASVTRIGEKAFWSCHALTAITLPGAGVEIGEGAFQMCLSLASVNITGWVRSIGANAFLMCADLTEIDLPEGLESIGAGAFDQGFLEVAHIPSTVTFIGDNAFPVNSLTTLYYNAAECALDFFGPGWGGISTLHIGKAVRVIPDNAFERCYGLTSLDIPGTVQRIGNSAFSSCEGLTTLTLGEGIQEIGSTAFAGCTALTAVSIPGTVESLETTFNGCLALTDVTIGDGVQRIGFSAFFGCEALTSIDIPGSVEAVGLQAFANCSNLAEVNLGNGVDSIGVMAFVSCTALTTMTIPASMKHIAGGAFDACPLATLNFNAENCNFYDDYGYAGNPGWSSITTLHLGDAVKNIPEEAFRGCEGLTSVDIPAGVDTIGTSAFAYSGLETLTVAEGLRHVGDNAFGGCEGLTSLVLPGGVRSIGEYAFEGAGLTSVSLPEGLETIGEGAFMYCEGLADFRLPASVSRFGMAALGDCYSLETVTVAEGSTHYTAQDGVLFTYAMDSLVCYPAGRKAADYTVPAEVKGLVPGAMYSSPYLTSVTLPEGMTEVTYGNFMMCPALTTVHLPASLEIINMACFQQCPALTAIDLPDALTVIGDGAFSESPLLTTLDFPAGMTYIGDGAFGYCTGLKSITVRAATPPTIGEYTFEEVPTDILLNVPEGSLPLYRTAEYWERFTNWQGIPGSGIASPVLSECITVHHGEVHINIIGMGEAQVYDTTGRLVLRTTETRFTLPTGTYIILIGKETAKVTV